MFLLHAHSFSTNHIMTPFSTNLRRFSSMMIPASSRSRIIGLLRSTKQCKSLCKHTHTDTVLLRASFCSQHTVSPEDDAILESTEILKRIEKHVPPIKVGKHGIEIVSDVILQCFPHGDSFVSIRCTIRCTIKALASN